MRDYLLPVALFLSAVVIALAFRYESFQMGALDRWTGCIHFIDQRVRAVCP